LPVRSVTLELGTIAYTDVGSGPPVLLIHGFGDEVFTWRHQLHALGDQFRLYALDLIGHGFSAHPPIEYKAEIFIACVLQFMDALGIRSASFVGSSLGAAIALCLAKYHPERVERLVLLGPTIPGTEPMGRFLPWVMWLAQRGPLGEWFLRPRFKAAVRLALRDAVADRALITDEIVDYYFALTRRPGFAQAYLSTARHWLGWAAHRPSFGELHMPVLILWGEQDRVHPFRQAGLLRTLIPQARLTSFPGCGHLPHVEQPEAVNALLREFLAGDARTRAAGA